MIGGARDRRKEGNKRSPHPGKRGGGSKGSGGKGKKSFTSILNINNIPGDSTVHTCRIPLITCPLVISTQLTSGGTE
jgi:hypothetical protein